MSVTQILGEGHPLEYPCRLIHKTLDHCYFLLNCRIFHWHFSYYHLHTMGYGLNSKLCWVSEQRLWHSAELHNRVRLSEVIEVYLLGRRFTKKRLILGMELRIYSKKRKDAKPGRYSIELLWISVDIKYPAEYLHAKGKKCNFSNYVV